MKYKYIWIVCILFVIASCKKDFLEKPPLDELSDGTFWTSESNVRTASFGFYSTYFVGYSSGFSPSPYYDGHYDKALSDDFAAVTPVEYIKQVPASGGGWTFSHTSTKPASIRRANQFIQKVQNIEVGANMSEEAKAHWTGVGRFFRAYEYSLLVQRFGDVPWFDKVLDENDTEQLYRPRDSRAFVMDKVLEDFQFAVENVRLNDGARKLTVNKDVVLAFMSRMFLFEGTWQKYHNENPEKAKQYFEAAKWAANELMSSGRYSLGNYREVFTSTDLSNNPEIILFRQYAAGILTHSVMSYNNKEPQRNAANKSLVDTYLASDGLPISISSSYKGDKGIENVMTDRDGRIKETFVSSTLLLSGESSAAAVTGFSTHKFKNEALANDPTGVNSLNITDGPVIRYGEVLVNYAEAALELASVGGAAFTNDDLNKSINVLRDRPGVNLPHLQVAGDAALVSGFGIYDDPNRDPTVSSILWEIRRERRVELVYEGFRYDDLRRWKKLEYTDTEKNPDINKGAWINKNEHPELAPDIVLNKDQNAKEGYITPAWSGATSMRVFNDSKLYLYPLPLDQIVLYREQGGVELKQNPGWD